MAFQTDMHDRNIYKDRPDFRQIALEYPEFRQFAVPDEKGKVHVDFNDKPTLRAVTKVLLKRDFDLSVEIPEGFLIPTVPQRLNYILWIEDLLSILPTSGTISGIDVGTGPCAIFSLLGAKKNSWKFTSTETSDEAIHWAEKNIKANVLNSLIKVVKVDKETILKDVLTSSSDKYDFCLCNPPFFDKNEGIRMKNLKMQETFAESAKKEEIISGGGEVSFVQKMITESLAFRDRVRLYTSMFGKKKNFLQIWKELKSLSDVSITKTEFCQGNTIRWGVAWSFIHHLDFESIERPKLKKPTKAKPPLVYEISNRDKEKEHKTVKNVLKVILATLSDLEILCEVNKCAENYAEIQITSDKNTWSNQRRKRRELLKEKGPQTASVNADTCISSNDSKSVINVKGGILKTEITALKTEISENKKELSDQEAMQIDDSMKFLETQGKNKSHSIPPSGCNSISTIPPCSETKHEDVKIAHTNKTCSTSAKMLKNPCKELTIEPIDTCHRYSETIPVFNLEDVAYNKETDFVTNKRKRLSDNNDEPSKKIKSNLNIKVKSDEDLIFEEKSLLYSVLKLIKAKDYILFEMNCPPDRNRELMYQVFQLLKNKLSKM